MNQNVIEYQLFLPCETGSNTCKEKDVIETYLAEVTARASMIIGDYIWQNESFGLGVKSEKDDVPMHLAGSTDFGDNIDDEWFIVYLLFELSRQFSNLVARIFDNDGEFLLIEAAKYLPDWLEPETSSNRVFVHEGRVHIIPYPSNPGEITVYPTGNPSLSLALSYVCGKHRTEASHEIQTAIMERIKGYPFKLKDSFHRTHCIIPAPLCHVLNRKPSLIAPAVQAFCNRDFIDVKVCRSTNIFSADCLVKSLVRFTRCLYAQLIHQKFQPDSWTNWKLPLPSHRDYQAHLLGVKLVHGFEILCSKVNEGTTCYTKIVEPSGKMWQLYLQCLKKQGYFKDEIEGSKMYMKLLEKAEEHFKQHVQDKKSYANCLSAGEEILKLLKEDFDVIEMKKDEACISPADDDSWLSITPEELGNMLSKYSTISHKKNDQDNTHSIEEFDIDSVTHCMKSFVDNVSSHEGAEFPWSNDEPGVNFDAGSFMNSVQKLLDESSEDQNDDDSSHEDSHDDDLLEISEEDDEESGDTENELTSYIKQMDKELEDTDVLDNFKRIGVKMEKVGSSCKSQKTETDSESDEDSSSSPLDIDINLVKNLLNSYSSQQGLTGPVSNILSSMGMVLPQDTDS